MQVIRWAIAAIMFLPFAVQAVEPEVRVIVTPSVPEIGSPAAPAAPVAPQAPAEQVATSLHKLQVVFPLDSIVDWVQAKLKLGHVTAVKDYKELAVTRSFVKLELSYTGEIPALAAEMQKNGLSLLQQDNDWILK